MCRAAPALVHFWLLEGLKLLFAQASLLRSCLLARHRCVNTKVFDHGTRQVKTPLTFLLYSRYGHCLLYCTPEGQPLLSLAVLQALSLKSALRRPRGLPCPEAPLGFVSSRSDLITENEQALQCHAQ